MCFFRYYILRERPTAGSRSDNIIEDIPLSETGEGALLGLPESETDLDVRFIRIFKPTVYHFMQYVAFDFAEFNRIQYRTQSTHIDVRHHRRC